MPESFSGFDLPLVLRQQPHLITQTDKPLKLLAQLNEIESTRQFNYFSFNNKKKIVFNIILDL